jgi:hypothetical protein
VLNCYNVKTEVYMGERDVIIRDMVVWVAVASVNRLLLFSCPD